MAYRLLKSESISASLRRIVAEELQAGFRQLTRKRPDTATAVHEVRKSIKKVRAALRLVRDQLGPYYSTENARLREISRRLAEARDAEAMLQTLSDLEERTDRSFPSARDRLGAERAKQQSGQRGVLKEAANGLRKTLEDEPPAIPENDFSTLAPGLRKTFRQGRKALRVVREDSSDANYHDLRKRVKDHWYHVRLLGNLGSKRVREYEKRLKRLGNWLGDDNNLAVLRQKIHSQPGAYGKPVEIAALQAAIQKRQRQLRRKALAYAEEIYGKKPGEMAGWLERRWRAWKK